MLKRALLGVALSLTLVAASARADIVVEVSMGADVAQPATFDGAWTDDLGSFALPCSGVDFAGCCEAGVLFFCNDANALEAIECARNEHYTTCASHEDPEIANCMQPDESFIAAPRCSVEPSPYPGEPSLPDPGDLAGTCPTLPATMHFAFDEAPYCDGIPQDIDIHQVGCAFVMTPPSGGASGMALGHMNGRVVQMNYRVGGGETIVTCLGEIAEGDEMLRGRCEGPWGFGEDACRFSFSGTIDWTWEAPAPVVDPGTGPQPGVDAGTSGETDGGGSGGCTTGAGSPTTALGLLLLALALGFRRSTLQRRP